MTDQGNLYVIAAPSGTGKTTLVNALLNQVSKIMVSISHTTRAKRPNEIEGINYHFIDLHTFQQMIAHQDFLEHAKIFDNYYGTSKSWVAQTLAEGIDVVLEIDWQGHQQIKRLFPHAISIFILPPSLEDLKNRLINRNQDSMDIIQKRLANAEEAISHIREFDYVVLNDTFDHAVADLKVIIEAGRLLQSRQQALLDKLKF